MNEKLKQLRKEKGWSQMETAIKLGISIDYLRSLEIGRKTPSLKLLRKIANTYGCGTIDELLHAS
ncbi:helix-turn-helix domain-containing protein [Paenibacillus sp. 1P03SA]|uniref:helix-turn-helix domain-containing protein n=1 Tax=Paenibacillus sp. 1P03SA TaxID=3132294 RepID=UPI0039A093FD